MERHDHGARGLARLMGWFYLVTGAWPLLHIRSFEWVTGPKTDRWLVKTVGALIAATGATLLLAARRDRVTPEVAVLAAGNAAALATIDVVYVAKRRIRPVYLLDAVAESILVAGWVRAMARRPGGDRPAAGPA
jgi:hypothetical protein